MIGFVAVAPNGAPLGIYATMSEAQEAIAAAEPDIVLQGKYVIHPIREHRDAEVAGLRLRVTFTLEKHDLDGNLIEVINGEG